MNDRLYFSEVSLDLDSEDPEFPRGATAPYVVHQVVSDMFGQFNDRPFLYRTDNASGNRRDMLILSRREPERGDPSRGRTYGTVRKLRTKPFQLDVPEGTRLDFEIRLNATTDLARESKRSKRMDVWEAVWQRDKQTRCTPDEIYTAYLARKLCEVALVDCARVTARGLERVRRKLSHSSAITYVAVNLIGTLTVLDAVQLREVMARGIGRSKGFGCGLLCLSRPGSVLPRRFPEIARRLYS